MYKNQHRWIQLTLMFIDCALSILAFIAAGIWRYGKILNFINTTECNEIILVIIISSFISFLISGLYRDIFVRGYLHEFNRVFIHCISLVLYIALYSFATRNNMALSRLTLVYFFCINFVFIYAAHLLIKKAEALHGKGSKGWKLLIIADAESIEATCRTIHSSSLKDRVIGAYLLDKEKADGLKLSGIPLIDPPEDIVNYIVQNPIDEVLLSVTEPRFMSGEIQAIKSRIVRSGIIFSLRVWPLVQNEPYVIRLEEFGKDYIMSFGERTYSYSLIQLKRIMDILGGCIGSIVTVILSLFLIPAILIESPGPVFFRQKRVGRNGRIFTLLKFRSMYKDAEQQKANLMKKNEMKGLLFKMDDDPRVTKVGKFIRKTSLDEFPQFFNVLRGDMSLVGTRPPTLDEYKYYTCEQKKRLCFRPGITGIWQTSGRNDITDFDEVLQMDLQYIRDWSVYLDIKLLLKTVVVVLLRKGAK